MSEVLIAIFLSSLIMAAMGQTYVSVKTHYQWQEKQFSKAQEALLLVDWLKTQIQSAGNFGCNQQSALTFDPSAPAYLKKGVWLLKSNASYLPKAVKRNAVVGSQVLMLSKLTQPLNALVQGKSNSDLITLVKPTHLKAGQKVIINDCQFANISMIKSVSPLALKVNLVNPLFRAYGNNATMGALEFNFIYLRKVGAGKALFVSNGKRSEELDPSVTEMTMIKKNNGNGSLLHVKLKREKGDELDFYVGMKA